MKKNKIMTNPDCMLDGKVFNVDKFLKLNSDQLASIVGKQSPNGYLEDLSNYKWKFEYINIEDLRYATEYNEEPKGGWAKVYLEFLADDEKAAKYTPECAGRDKWIREKWTQCSDIYPLFVVLEDNNYRLLDGHHRLAGAFYYNLKKVAIILGCRTVVEKSIHLY